MKVLLQVTMMLACVFIFVKNALEPIEYNTTYTMKNLGYMITAGFIYLCIRIHMLDDDMKAHFASMRNK